MEGVPGLAKGGYIGKMHSWNGTVPGPYGKEVNAVLKAGTEGVYQNDYIRSLQNQSIGNTYTIAPVIHAAPGMDETMISKIHDIISADTPLDKDGFIINKLEKEKKRTLT